MSCLFNSLSHFVDDDANTIRQKICDFLNEDGCLFDSIRCSDVTQWGEHKGLEEYVRNMRSTSTWGGAIEIKAFCEIYKRGVKVYSTRAKDLSVVPVAEFVPQSSDILDNGMVNLLWTGSHYDPMNPTIISSVRRVPSNVSEQNLTPAVPENANIPPRQRIVKLRIIKSSQW
jgi:hypothetical protein